MGYFSKIDGVNMAGLCDPDANRLASAKRRFPEAKGWPDLRSMLDDDGIDAAGLHALRRAIAEARPDWKLSVVAPDSEKSSSSSLPSITGHTATMKAQ